MVPAHNKEVVLQSTLEYLLNELNYSNYEVLVIDDGSTDQTPTILAKLQERYPNLRVVRIEANKGKAHAFNVGMFFAKGKYILSNDADTLPKRDALRKYMRYFESPAGVNYAAITANMDVYNRTTLWGKSQTVEFSSIVGIIKRSQTAVSNTMYAYSGANTMYCRLLPFLENITHVKFVANAFNKSATHWIEVTLGEWQLATQKAQVGMILGKIERLCQEQLADQLHIPYRQGYLYARPEKIECEDH